MAFLGISLKSAKMGTGRAILSHLNEKREDKLREQERQNRLDDMRTEFEMRDDYAIKAEDRAYDREINRLKETNTIKSTNEEQDWRLGLQRASELSKQTGKDYAYLGNGNFKILEEDDPELTFADRLVQAQQLTEQFKDRLEPNQMFFPTGKSGFELIGKAKKEGNGTIGIAGLAGKGFDVFKTESSVSEIGPTNSFTFPFDNGNKMGLLALADETRLQKEKVPYHNASHALGTLLETDLSYHIDRYRRAKAGETIEGGDLFAYTRKLFRDNAPSILEGLKDAKNQEGVTAIPNPMIRFNLTEYAAQGPQQAEEAKFIATEIIAPALTLQKELALQALNLPAETPVQVDENFNFFIDSEVGAKLEPYSESVRVDGQVRKQLKPEFKNLATEIAQYSGRSMTDVLSHAIYSSGDPLKHMQDVQAFSATMKSKTNMAGLQKIKLNELESNHLLNVIKGAGTASTSISTIRSMIPASPPREMVQIMVSPEGGGKKPVWNRTVKNFSGIDIEGARQRAESSAKARKTIATIRELMAKHGASTDPIALLQIKFAGGVEALGTVTGLLNDFEKYLTDSDIAGTGEELNLNREARQETLSEIRNMRSTIAKGGRLEASALAMMLSRQLGYYMAGAVQGGGSTGRNISDFDVRNNMNAMQLDTFAPTAVKRANLEYLYEEMDQTYAIYSSYASSGGDFATWQATQIYDDLVQGTHTDLTQLMARVGAIPADEAEQRRLRLQPTGAVTSNESLIEEDPFGEGNVQENQ